jgi:hypothetical protein
MGWLDEERTLESSRVTRINPLGHPEPNISGSTGVGSNHRPAAISASQPLMAASCCGSG